jgi:hypothetical protein
VSVSDGPNARAEGVHYLLHLFDAYDLHFAQTYVPLDVTSLIAHSVEPQ